MNTSRPTLSCLIALSSFLIGGTHAENFAETGEAGRDTRTRPNILLMMCDDMGWRDLSCFQNDRVPTPHVDRLALEGMKLTQFYAASAVCTPTRASVLTGKYPLRFDIRAHFNSGKGEYLPVSTTIPKLLQESGYSTVHIGKWHLGGLRVRDFAMRDRSPGPIQHGFQHYLTQREEQPLRGNMLKKRNLYREGGTCLLQDDQQVGSESPYYKAYLTDILGEEAIRQIKTFHDSDQPNILLILVDDMGYSDLGCYGGEIKTPHIDALATNGLRYSQFYNSARCVPSRAAILSGYYAQQINRDTVLDIKEKSDRPKWAPLLPKYLKRAGYRSYHSGKWHIDGKPMGNGFDRSLYIDSNNFFNPEKLFKDDKPHPPGEGFYATTAVADHTIEVLKEHQDNHADQPFFSYVAFTAPHFPLQALPEDIERVGDRYTVGWDVIRNQRWERLQNMGLIRGTLSEVEYDQGPPFDFSEQLTILGDGEIKLPVPWKDLTDKQKEFQQTKMQIHAAMIERVDTEVGRIIEQLKAMNAFEDTVIFFLSDNGASAEMMVRGGGHNPKAAPGSADSFLCLGPGWSTVANTPFRKHKIWAHEGGTCTPMIVHGPNHKSQPGEIRETPGHVIDFVPTILDLAGITLKKKKVPFPGKSLLPTFKQDRDMTRTLWWSHRDNHAVRSGDWKLVKSNDGEWELFQINQDRAETKNLAAQHPGKCKELKKLWEDQVNQFREDRKIR